MRSPFGSIDELLAEAGFLRRLARGLTNDAADADDLVQDTFVAALEHPPGREGSIRGWLATVAANLSRNKRRERTRRADREHAAARDESVGDERVSQEKIELQRTLFELLLTLPAEQRAVVYLRYYEELTPTAIAERLGVPLRTVKTRYTRAMVSLRERLDARSGGDRRVWMEALLVPWSAPHISGTTGGVVAATIGGIAMKKLVLVAAAAVLVALGWFAFSHGQSVEPVAASTSSASAKLDEVPAKSAPSLAQTPLPTREPLATTTKTSTGALEVHLSWSDGTPAASVGLDAHCETDPAPREETTRAISDANGIARFDGLFAGKVRLKPDMRDRFSGEVEAGTTRKLEHTFEQGEQVRGRVVDPNGKPVAAASVWSDGNTYPEPTVRQATSCADDGSFLLRDVSADVVIGARCAHFRPSACLSIGDLPANARGEREIELKLQQSGGRVRGVVLAPDGTPVDRARVIVGQPCGMIRDQSGRTAQPAAVETDNTGAFELVEDIIPGQQPIFATARGYPVWEGSIDVVAGATSSIEIHLEISARIEGRVLDVDSRPIGGIEVIAAQEDRGGWYWDMLAPSKTVSDEQGRFTLDWIHPGNGQLNARDYTRPEVGRGQNNVVCVAGETTHCDVHLQRGNTIAGRVQDKSGMPLAGWRVQAESTLGLYPRSAKTGADGTFLLQNLGDGEHNVLVRGPKFTAAPRARANRVSIGAKDVVLVVQDVDAMDGTLRAHVVDSSGASLANVVVTLWKSGGPEGSSLELNAKTGVVEAHAQPGRYRIRLSRGNTALLVGDEFALVENQQTELGDLVLAAMGRAEIRIPGLPNELARLSLSLERPGGYDSGSLECTDGVWRSNELAAGRWVVAWHESEIWLRDAVIEIPAGATGRFDLGFEPARRLELTFTNPGSGGLTVETQGADGKLSSFNNVGLQTRDGHTSCRIPLPVGHSSIVVRTSEGLSGKVDVDMDSKPHPPVEIPLH